jgi:hypothetical protein
MTEEEGDDRIGEKGREVMGPEKKKAEWQQNSEEVLSGMIEWRLQHLKATFREVEEEVRRRSGERL